jgi:ABC-type sugar transport system permease subunit
MNKQLNVRCTKRTFLITSVTIISAMCLLPLVFTVIISTREYTGMRMRLIGNIDKGLSFYTDFIGSYYFPRLMRNTVRLTICPAAVSAAFAIPLILAVSNLAGQGVAKHLLDAALAVPSFVPLAYLSSMFINVFSYEGHMTQALVSLGIIGENRDLSQR